MANANRRIFIIFLPLIFIIAIGVLFAMRLGDGKSEALPSALIGKAAPQMSLPPLEGMKDAQGVDIKGFNTEQLYGNISLVNIFASWCGPCRTEHPLLIQIAEQHENLQMIGINMRDKADNAHQFLNELGNPYDIIGIDVKGRAVVEWGGYGVPETFLVDQEGIIRFKHVGPLNHDIIQNQLTPLVQSLNQ